MEYFYATYDDLYVKYDTDVLISKENFWDSVEICCFLEKRRGFTNDTLELYHDSIILEQDGQYGILEIREIQTARFELNGCTIYAELDYTLNPIDGFNVYGNNSNWYNDDPCPFSKGYHIEYVTNPYFAPAPLSG